MKKAGLVILFVLIILISGCGEKALPVKEKIVMGEVKSQEPAEPAVSCRLDITKDYLSLCPKGMICLKEVCVKPEETFAEPESDLPFLVDCSELEEAKRAECNQYIKYTEKVIYPILREMTGTNLSACYEKIIYQFIPGREGHGVASESGYIQFGESYLMDKWGLINHFDNAHELFHVVGYCNGALDMHYFHQMMEDKLWERLERDKQPIPKSRLQEQLENLKGELPAIRNDLATNLYPSLYNFWYKSSECNSIVLRLTNILYDQKGGEHMWGLYNEMKGLKVSIPPGHPLKATVAEDPGEEENTAKIIVLVQKLREELPSTPLMEEAFGILREKCGMEN